MGFGQWLQRRFWPKPDTVPNHYSIPIGSDQSLDELVDFILDRIENDCRLDALCAYTSMQFGISGDYAALAWDRVQEGIERAGAGDPTAIPNRESDPVAWISFHRAIASGVAKRREQGA